jgi:maltose O-acetyltransferase
MIGSNVRIVSSARVMVTSSVNIGDDTFVGHECMIVGGDEPINIGPNVDIGPRVTFATGTHAIQPEGPHVAGRGYSLPVTIGEGCWICTGAVILGGTSIGPRSIVAAGAIVRGYFPGGCLIGGVPARVLQDTLATD